MKTITDYLESQLQGELDKLWADGTLNEEKVESFRTLHERTPYNKRNNFTSKVWLKISLKERFIFP